MPARILLERINKSKCTTRTCWENRLFQTGESPASREQSLHTAALARAVQSSFPQGKSEAASRAALGSRVNKGQSSLMNHSHGASPRGDHACGAREEHSKDLPLPGAACEVAAHPAAGDSNTPGSQLLHAHLSPLEMPQTDANCSRIYHGKRDLHPTHLQAHSPCSGWYETSTVVTRTKQPTLVMQPQLDSTKARKLSVGTVHPPFPKCSDLLASKEGDPGEAEVMCVHKNILHEEVWAAAMLQRDQRQALSKFLCQEGC